LERRGRSAAGEKMIGSEVGLAQGHREKIMGKSRPTKDTIKRWGLLHSSLPRKNHRNRSRTGGTINQRGIEDGRAALS